MSQRPDARETAREDMEVLTRLAGLADRHTGAGRRFGFSDLLAQFRRSLAGELDYRREARNLARLRSSRRYVLLGIVIFAVVITPGGDPISPSVMSAVMYVLYEFTIFTLGRSSKAEPADA